MREYYYLFGSIVGSGISFERYLKIEQKLTSKLLINKQVDNKTLRWSSGFFCLQIRGLGSNPS